MRKHRRNILRTIGTAALCAAFILPAAIPANASARANASIRENVSVRSNALVRANASIRTEAGSIQIQNLSSRAEGLTRDGRDLTRIQISVGDGQETPVFRAGEKAQLQISVKNSGNTDAQNVRIAPVIQNEADWPFELDKLNYGLELGTLEAGKQADAVWGADNDMLTVKDEVTGKAYKLSFRITYDDGERAYETERYVFVKTTAKDKPDEEKPSGGKPSDPGASSGEPSGRGDSGQSPAAPDGTGADTGLTSGGFYNSEPIITGGGSAGTNGSVPRVIVTGFSTEPGEVRAGSDFKLVVHLKNTSSHTGVSNMLFDFQAPSSGTEAAAEAPAFLPSSGSSSIYLESIPAGGTRDIAIDLNARADLVQKPYSISMSMKYEDGSATQYEAQSSLAIPVKQEARFEFSKIQIAPDTISVGEEANISCSLYNLGRVKMYNVKARFEGKMIESQEQFIGNLDAGATGTIDSIVTAKKETKGGEDCKLILTYEDDAGNVSTAEQKFTMTVLQETVPADMGMLTEEIPEEGGAPVGLIAAVILISAAGITGAAIFIKSSKGKLREAEEEELFDEVERLTEDEH